MEECHFYKLPNELLLHLLAPLSTPELLPLTVLSHRIYTIILRILHTRLVDAAELNSHSLLLECYHPSAKLTEPSYFCSYRGTDGLTLYRTPLEADHVTSERLGELRNMYSRFRPHRQEYEPSGRRIARPPGDVPGSRTYAGTSRDKFKGEAVKQLVNLDGHELFTQLVAQANLVKTGPRHGLFTCFVDIEHGVVRVWREWLGHISKIDGEDNSQVHQGIDEELNKGKDAMQDVSTAVAGVNDERILWVSPAKNTGIRFNVKERKIRRDTPILISVDEDLPVSYEIEYDELLIRTSHLLLMLEKSLVQEENPSGKAVVFGSFA